MKTLTTFLSILLIAFLSFGSINVSATSADKNKSLTQSSGVTGSELRVCSEVEPGYGVGTAPPGASQLVLENKARWWSKNSITVRFLEGDEYVRERVKKYANDWSNYAHITFQFVESADADVRVAFKDGDGSWSFVGTDALGIPKNKATMNFGWLRSHPEEVEFQRVIRHEFGHALGFVHEHQHPQAVIPWNKPAVYAYYAKKRWPPSEVDLQVFQKYSIGETTFAQYDPKSIMHYPIPAELLLDPRWATGWNTDLSETDKQFAGRMYPEVARPRQRILYATDAKHWTVADRLVGKNLAGYKLALSGDFRASDGDEIILINPTTGSNLLLFQEGVNDWNVSTNILPTLAVNDYSMAVSYDFDGNGKTDIFLANGGGDNRLILQQLTGAFVVKGEVAGKTAVNNYNNVVAYDFDGNGKGDLFFVNREGDNRLLLQDDRGVFNISSQVAAKQAVNNYDHVVASDFDKNGLGDLFFLNSQGENRLFLQTSRGKFETFGTDGQIVGLKAVNGYNYVVASDFNNDGRPDLLFLNIQSGENRLIFQGNDGRFNTVFTLAGTKALNNYALVTAGRFDKTDPALDMFLFEP